MSEEAAPTLPGLRISTDRYRGLVCAFCDDYAGSPAEFKESLAAALPAWLAAGVRGVWCVYAGLSPSPLPLMYVYASVTPG
jgi:hypothetical protein